MRKGACERRCLNPWPGIAVIVLATLAVSLLLGRFPRPYFSAPSEIAGDGLARDIFFSLRLPRVLAAFLLGMVLAASGTVFQMIFRNPLVDSGFLGVSQGAAFGASLGIIFLGGSPWAVQAGAAVFALLGLGASYFLARRIRLGDWVLRLVLAGIAVSAIYSAGTGSLKYIADPHKQLPDITFWLLGGMWGITWPDVIQILPVAVFGLVVMALMRWRLNILSMRDETAFSLGVTPGRERLLILFAATVATAAVISKAGQVGWVGLIMPHIARRIVGSDAQRALPAAILLGGVFVLLCDDAARTLLSGEIPLGILTSFVGTILFLGLLMGKGLGGGR
ncbi:MAG: FecCD family ABC transporter permease [Candidatus Aminicenantales bacterium]